MAAMAGSPQQFEDGGFDYDDNNGQNEQNIFENANMGGGIGDAMGLENEDNLLAMEEELNYAGQTADGQTQDTIEVTFSITFDEDDSNQHNLDLV